MPEPPDNNTVIALPAQPTMAQAFRHERAVGSLGEPDGQRHEGKRIADGRPGRGKCCPQLLRRSRVSSRNPRFENTGRRLACILASTGRAMST